MRAARARTSRPLPGIAMLVLAAGCSASSRASRDRRGEVLADADWQVAVAVPAGDCRVTVRGVGEAFTGARDYDRRGRLVAAQRLGFRGSDQVEKLFYDGDRPIRIESYADERDPTHAGMRHVTTTRIEYDTSGALARIAHDTLSYRDDAGVYRVVDQGSDEIVFRHHGARLVERKDATEHARFAYELDRLASITWHRDGDRDVTAIERDSQGRPVAARGAGDRQTFFYDASARLIGVNTLDEQELPDNNDEGGGGGRGEIIERCVRTRRELGLDGLVVREWQTSGAADRGGTRCATLLDPAGSDPAEQVYLSAEYRYESSGGTPRLVFERVNGEASELTYQGDCSAVKRAIRAPTAEEHLGVAACTTSPLQLYGTCPWFQRP